MRTVQSTIEELSKFPPDALVYGYTGLPFLGEGTGIVIDDMGFIEASESNTLDIDPAEDTRL